MHLKIASTVLIAVFNFTIRKVWLCRC